MYKINVGSLSFQVTPSGNDTATMNDTEKRFDLIRESEGSMHLLRDNKGYNVQVVRADYATKTFTLKVNGTTYELQAKDKYDLLLEELGMENLAGAGENELKAPMPGLVLKVEVEAGTEVSKGDAILVLEAMKMENVLKSPVDGTVKSIKIETGQAVEKNAVLVEFE
tara:strand:- start:38 stop:538 length:501 start_codon:yes stop_codon:yes gene_type:complete